MTQTPRHLRRTLLSVLAAGGLVVGGVLSVGPGGLPSANLFSTYDAEVRARAEALAGPPPITDPGAAAIAQVAGTARLDGHGHVHNDPTTKNAVSRSGEAAGAPDRTTPAQRAASRARVAAQRTQREPRLVGVPLGARGSGCPRACTRWRAGATRWAGSRSPSRPPASAATSSTHPTARSSPRPRPAALRGRPPPRRTRTGRSGRRAGSSPSPSPTAVPCGPPAACSPWGRRRPSRCAARRGAQRSPRSRPTSADGRSAASRLPGGPWLRRSARPRPDPRVPGRPGHLQPAVPQVRRSCRARRLPRPPGRGRPRRRARGRARRQDPRQRPRPGGLADLLLLAQPALADAPAGLLQVARALVARRPADPHQPAQREQRPVRDLPAEEELVRRPRRGPPAGRGHAGDAGLHRRAVRRPRPRLVPHRHRPLRGPQGHQRGQAARRDGHGDLGPRWAATSSSAGPPAPRRRCSPSSRR